MQPTRTAHLLSPFARLAVLALLAGLGACGSATVGIVASSSDDGGGGTTVVTVTEIQIVEVDSTPASIFLTATGPANTEIDVEVYARKEGGQESVPVTLRDDESLTAPDLSTVPADGTSVATITITVLDENGNPVAGQAVVVDVVDGSTDIIEQPADFTDDAGQTTATVASLIAETMTIGATVNPGPRGVPLEPLDVEFVPVVSPSLSTAVANPEIVVLFLGEFESRIEVTVRDLSGFPIAGKLVGLDAVGTFDVLQQPAAPTDTAGFTFGVIENFKSGGGIATVTATVDPGGPTPVVLDDTPTVTFDNGELLAADSSAAADPSVGVVADGVDASRITIQLRDQGGRPLQDRMVWVFCSGSNNIVLQPPPTDRHGHTVATIASTTAETKTLTVIVDPGPRQILLPTRPKVSFVPEHPAVFYVRAGGSDLASGRNPAEAWRTLARAASAVQAGDTVLVGAGTYVESLVLAARGTVEQPIRFAADRLGITGEPGEVLVDAGGAPAAFHLAGAAHVVLEGFTLTGAAPGDGPGGAILVDGGAHEVTLRANEIHGNTRGIDVRAADALLVESNRISANSGPGGEGVRIRDAGACVLRNNLVYANSGCGVHLAESGEATLENNTLHANGDDNLRVEGSGASVSLRHNLVTAGLRDGLDFAEGVRVASAHNLVSGHAGADWLGARPGKGDASSDPRFVDPAGADGELGGASRLDDRFQLEPDSPALDAGAVDAAAVVLSDGATLAKRTTTCEGVRTDRADAGKLDLGYHYEIERPSPAPPVPPRETRAAPDPEAARSRRSP